MISQRYAAILALVCAGVAGVAYTVTRPVNVGKMNPAEQTQYITRCAGLVVVVSSLASGEGRGVQAEALLQTAFKLNDAAARHSDITTVTNYAIKQVEERREELLTGRLTVEELGRQSEQCLTAIKAANLL